MKKQNNEVFEGAKINNLTVIENLGLIQRNNSKKRATMFLCNGWNSAIPLNEENIKYCAKHEAIHLLLARLSAVGQYRFVF